MMVLSAPKYALEYPIVVPALMFKVLARFWFDTNMSPAAMHGVDALETPGVDWGTLPAFCRHCLQVA